jgi:hypothetical protein
MRNSALFRYDAFWHIVWYATVRSLTIEMVQIMKRSIKILLIILAAIVICGIAWFAYLTVRPSPIKQLQPPTTSTPLSRSCATNADCPAGYRCEAIGPVMANQPIHKVCVAPGEAVPL